MVENLWNDEEAAGYEGDLGQRVYTSRLLGRDKSAGAARRRQHLGQDPRDRTCFGEDEEILYVKGSGWDLETIEAAGFSPVRLARLLRPGAAASASPIPQMVNELRTQHDPGARAPTPSVEAILHAILPFKFVDHTHADAVIAVTNTPDGEAHVREIYGDAVVVIPYVMPGFDLARLCAERFPAEAGPEHDRHGAAEPRHLLVRRHGARVLRAHDRRSSAWRRGVPASGRAPGSWRLPGRRARMRRIALRESRRLRREISRGGGLPDGPAPPHATPAASPSPAATTWRAISQQGPATPDHVIRTKRLPLLGRDVEAYAARLSRLLRRARAAAPTRRRRCSIRRRG